MFSKFGSAGLRHSVQICSNFVTKCVIHLLLVLVHCPFLCVITTASIRKWICPSAAASKLEAAEEHQAPQAALPLVGGLAGPDIRAQLPFSTSDGEGLCSNCVRMHKFSFLTLSKPRVSASVEIYQ